jgi:glutamate formiminotransferase
MALAIPNVSEGRDRDAIGALAAAASAGGAVVLDVHSDPVHHRSVLTVVGDDESVVKGMTALALRARGIDLRRHEGVHPRMGGLDVCPIVAFDDDMDGAVRLAHRTAGSIGDVGLPVYLYGAAAIRQETRELPDLRRGGLPTLIRRAEGGLAPDFGPDRIDASSGVVCVGARGVLIAFNVWLRGDHSTAKDIAGAVRSSGGGPPGIRALGVRTADPALSQVSMNLIDPRATGIDDAFRAVQEASPATAQIVATEIVGLVPQRFLPAPNGPAARLLLRPGRSLESVWRGLG